MKKLVMLLLIIGLIPSNFITTFASNHYQQYKIISTTE